MNFAIFYIFLIISLILSKISFYFYYISFFILISPLTFYPLEKFGFTKVKGFIYGILSSLIYLPFLSGISLYNFNQLPQVLAEEIFFRGYIQNEILKYTNIHISIIITSILFMIPHLVLSFSVISFLTFFPSLIFGYLYYLSKSIWASSIFHLFSNLFFQIFLVIYIR